MKINRVTADEFQAVGIASELFYRFLITIDTNSELEDLLEVYGLLRDTMQYYIVKAQVVQPSNIYDDAAEAEALISLRELWREKKYSIPRVAAAMVFGYNKREESSSYDI